MCGICGFTGLGSQADLEKMTASLAHRGPDDSGIFMDGNLGLGHRRLSILDIAGGRQPMHDKNTGSVIIYNGEIYNHLAIRLELEKLGHIFMTNHSDTETVLHAFEEWGTDCLIKFNGMFAFAIVHKNRLWLARDRFGEKPLFYIHNALGFAFASEICALKLWPGFEAAYDEPNLQRFFAWNYLPGESCIHVSCHSLEPGSWLCLDLTTGAIDRGHYWEFSLEPDADMRDEEELAEELRRLLIQAVERRFLSDVPVGLFLSGGIDSSAILAAAIQAVGPDIIRTFTIGFHEQSFDESTKAKEVASFFHVANDIEYLTEKKMQASIAPILSHMSEPFGDASLIPTAQLARFTRMHVTVALSGDGGDELFGGYDPLAALWPATLYRKYVPSSLHALLRKCIEYLPNSDQNMSLDFKMRRFLRGLSHSADIQIPVWMSGLDPAEIAHFFERPLSEHELYEEAFRLRERFPDADDLSLAFLFFTRIYLSSDILVKSDRASMMSSLETRAVFLDNDLVEFCRKLPMRFKYRPGHRKYLLKKALSAWLPQNILKQPKKGFGIPLNRWLRHLPVPVSVIPGIKPWVIPLCERRHKERKGDFRYFLWDVQAFSRQSN